MKKSNTLPKKTALAELVAVVYVGLKPSAYDNVAGSGKIWHGKGDVQHVTELQATTLCKYPDQWNRVASDAQDADNEAADDDKGNDDGDDEGDDNKNGGAGSADGLSPEEIAEILKTPLEKLTKAKLIQFAQFKLNKTLDPSLGKTAMVNQIEEWLKHSE
jgi:hypothetical protein